MPSFENRLVDNSAVARPFFRGAQGFCIFLIHASKTARIIRAQKKEETLSNAEQVQKLKEGFARRENAPAEDTGAVADPPPPKTEQPAVFPPHAPLPVGTQSLLDAQLGEALKIMRDYTDWVHSPSVPMEECMNAGDAIARMMTASATLAAVAVRLQKGEPESRHRMIVEYAEPDMGEGSAKSRKRISHGNP